MTQNKNAALGFIVITVLLDSIGFGIIIPVLPELIMEVTGDGLSDAAQYGGWLLFVYALMQFLSSPVMGNLSDRFGRRPVLLISLLIFAFDYILMAWAPSIGWLFLGRLIAGISASTFAIANAYIADLFPPDERSKNFGSLGAAFGCGFIFGPVIGGFLGELGPRVPFYATAGLTFLNFVFGYVVLPESLKSENRRSFDIRRANAFGAIKQLKRYRTVLRLAVANFLYMLGHHALPATWAYWAIERFSWDEREIGWSLGAVGIGMMFVQGFLIRLLIPKYGVEKVAYVGLLCSMLSFVGFAISSVSWMVYAFIVLGAGMGLVGPSINGLMSARIPVNEQGELQGALGSVSSLAAVISPPLMATVFSYFSGKGAVYFPGAAFLVAAFLVAASLSIFVKTVNVSEDSEKE